MHAELRLSFQSRTMPRCPDKGRKHFKQMFKNTYFKVFRISLWTGELQIPTFDSIKSFLQNQKAACFHSFFSLHNHPGNYYLWIQGRILPVQAIEKMSEPYTTWRIWFIIKTLSAADRYEEFLSSVLHISGFLVLETWCLLVGWRWHKMYYCWLSHYIQDSIANNYFFKVIFKK